MFKWIGEKPWFFPLPMTLASGLLSILCGVLVHELDPTLSSLIATCLVIIGAFAYVVPFFYIRYAFRYYITTTKRVLGMMDVYFTLVIALSNITMVIIVLSNPTNQHFTDIPVDAKGFDLYWTYVFSSMVRMFNSAGIGNSGRQTALGALPANIASVTGAFFFAGFVATVVSIIKFPIKTHEHNKTDRHGPYSNTY